MSSRTSSLGLNLHHACHRLVIWGIPENVNTAVQIFSRAHRYGQRREQYIWILTQHHPYDQVPRVKVVQKHMLQVLSESRTTRLSSDKRLRRLVNITDINNMMGHSGKRPDQDVLNAAWLYWQVMKVIYILMGFRCSPNG